MHERTRNDRAVAPVVGIALLLAITVLLAGTAAAFFFGFTSEPAEAAQPTAAFEFDADVGGGSDTLTITHVTGEQVLAENLYVALDGASCTESGTPDGRYEVADGFDFPAREMGAGMSIQVGTELGPGGTVVCPGSGNDLDLSAATVTLVWQNEAGDSGTYRTWEAE